MKKVEKIMEKIIENEEEIKELFNKESIDDLYRFFLEKDNTLTMEEFDNEVYDILENYSKTEITDIDENELEKISGGKKNLFQGALAASLSVLTLGSSINPSVFAAGSTKVEGTKVSKSSGIKSGIKGKYPGIREWISRNKKTIGIVSGVATVAIITTILVIFGVSRHKKQTVKPPVADQPNPTPALSIGVPVTASPTEVTTSPTGRRLDVPGTPPPPPPPPAPIPTVSTGDKTSPERDALLKAIREGKKLKKAPPRSSEHRAEETPTTPHKGALMGGKSLTGGKPIDPKAALAGLKKHTPNPSDSGKKTPPEEDNPWGDALSKLRHVGNPPASGGAPALGTAGAPLGRGARRPGNPPAPGGAPLGRGTGGGTSATGARRPGNPPASGGAPGEPAPGGAPAPGAPATEVALPEGSGSGRGKKPLPPTPPAVPGSEEKKKLGSASDGVSGETIELGETPPSVSSIQFGDGTDEFPAPSAPPAPSELLSGETDGVSVSDAPLTENLPSTGGAPASGAPKSGNPPSPEGGGTSGSASSGTTINYSKGRFTRMQAMGEIQQNIADSEERIRKLERENRDQMKLPPNERRVIQRLIVEERENIEKLRKQLSDLDRELPPD